MRYRAAPADTLLSVGLDTFTAVFHRPSGITHLLASPAPEILACLADGPLDDAALMARLEVSFDVADADVAALRARLAELVDTGLVEVL
ncbi:HPr-rel-A system PqqD family peptide chaperone [Sphingomonas sp. MA1305]|uniref:HPr-rel-A system PqqD family peptide chaperone n=1 Tax=Sphingomonas sp. MA1305 TaxID=2479204 RepID=UPI0018E01042|nr:HPr-rel-A system PqqD family peptide chaperone [Sphingomonas sp. MA1305]MBI0476635.1 HPr-rel-A system PqqD family peptide chaperone [Sphingomonas sp. MA1305]